MDSLEVKVVGATDEKEGGVVASIDAKVDDEIILNIPKRMVGKIIGKGGSMIREIRDTSGAKVDIKEENQDDQCNVIICGTKEQRDKAIKMVGDLNNNQQNGFRSKDIRLHRWEQGRLWHFLCLALFILTTRSCPVVRGEVLMCWYLLQLESLHSR